MSGHDTLLDLTVSESGSDLASLQAGRRRRSRSEVRWTARRSQGGHRWTSASRLTARPERERLAKIERENQILLQKILDCHLGYDRRRTSHIPRATRRPDRRSDVASSSKHPTSNQINAKQIKQKTDYENLLLLKKILSAKPSQYVRDCTRGLTENTD